MTASIRAALERWATRRVALAALAVAAACIAGLAWRQDRLGGLELLDSRSWYTPGEAAALFEALDRLDAGARTVYAATGLTIDMAFPAAYGLLFAILLVRLFRAPFFLLPLATAAADVLENATVAALALSYAGAPSPLRGWPRRSPWSRRFRLRRAGGDMRRRRPLAVAAPQALTVHGGNDAARRRGRPAAE